MVRLYTLRIYTLQLKKLISDIDDERINIDKIIVFSFDRFSRNIVDAFTMIKQLKDNDVIVESVIDNIDYSYLITMTLIITS